MDTTTHDDKITITFVPFVDQGTSNVLGERQKTAKIVKKSLCRVLKDKKKCGVQRREALSLT